MSTLWTIQVTPKNNRMKPWLCYWTVSTARAAAWERYCESTTAEFQKQISADRKKGILRAVKVTLEIAKEIK